MEKELLHRFFDGRASVEEEKQVLDWIDRDPANRRELLAERRLFDSMLMLADPGRTTRKPKVLTLPRWTREVLKYAAVILVVAGAGGIYVSRMYDKFLLTGNTITVPAGQHIDVQLPDGTKVWLNASSRLTYPETFDRRERRVTLEGEAYFEVARNTSHPFVVDMNRMEIEVLGTTFDARYERASGIAETTLNSGSICVRTSRSQQSVRLRPDERLVFNETTGSMIIEQVNASNYNSWIQPNLTFFDMTLEDIITNLERWFNVPIGTDASVDRTIRLSFHVRHESLEETLQVISLITGLQYTLDGESATFHTARTTRSR